MRDSIPGPWGHTRGKDPPPLSPHRSPAFCNPAGTGPFPEHPGQTLSPDTCPAVTGGFLPPCADTGAPCSIFSAHDSLPKKLPRAFQWVLSAGDTLPAAPPRPLPPPPLPSEASAAPGCTPALAYGALAPASAETVISHTLLQRSPDLVPWPPGVLVPPPRWLSIWPQAERGHFVLPVRALLHGGLCTRSLHHPLSRSWIPP